MAKKPDWRCGGARGLPLNMTRRWAGDAERERMLDAAGFGGAHPDSARAKRGFLLYDAANPTLKASYKLPFCDIIDGRLTAIASGVSAAKAFLNRTDAPKRELERAGAIIADYERRMEEEKKKEKSAITASPLFYGVTDPGTIARRMVNTPLALHAGAAHQVTALLRPSASPMTPLARLGDTAREGASSPRLYAVLNGVAVIPVKGILVPECGPLQAMFGFGGYDMIGAAYAQALADDDVRGIALDVDSPGGEVNGCFDLARDILAARGAKPSCAIVSGGAYSAAYALAAATGHIYVAETGGVGSIGILALVPDFSKALETAGIAVNVIQFGARKADGLEVLPLAPEARARFQADVTVLGNIFVQLVADARGISPRAVAATEAATFLGGDAVAHQLADGVCSKSRALHAFTQTL